MTTAKQDQEMRDLLIRLDQRVGDGFQNINTKLDDMNRRADGHETRIRTLEDWRSEFSGGTKAASLGWKLLFALGGGLGVLGLQATIVPKDKPIMKSETTIERSVVIPKH